MSYKLTKIDELILSDHTFLTPQDKCYYLWEYAAREGYSHSDSNNAIINFKKPLTAKNKPEWKYKEMAINQIASLLKEHVFTPHHRVVNQATIVPIPPSKCKADILYDDRLNQVLNIALKGKNADVKDLLLAKESTESYHENSSPRNSNIIKQNLEINIRESTNLKDTILLFDDMVTTGAHFKACKEIILDRFPEKILVGLFIARRAIPNKLPF